MISAQNSDVEENQRRDWLKDEKCEDCKCQQFPTPPSTPFESEKPAKLDKSHQSESVTCDKQLQTVTGQEVAEIDSDASVGQKKFHYLLVALLIAVLVSYLGGKVLHLRQAFELSSQIYQKQIDDLQNENTQLRNQLENLRVMLENVDLFGDEMNSLEYPAASHSQFTKKVWIGAGKNEKLVEIPDKEFQLPDYCTTKHGDQLFDEYNEKVCDFKKKKLERKIKKVQQSKSRENLDDIRVSIESVLDVEREADKSYEEILAEAKEKLWNTLRMEAAEKQELRGDLGVAEEESEKNKEIVNVEIPDSPQVSENPEKLENSESENQKQKNQDFLKNSGDPSEQEQEHGKDVIFSSIIQSDPEPDSITNEEIEEKIKEKGEKRRFNGGFKRGFTKIVLDQEVEAGEEKIKKTVRTQWKSEEESGEDFESKEFEEWKKKVGNLEKLKEKINKKSEDFKKFDKENHKKFQKIDDNSDKLRKPLENQENQKNHEKSGKFQKKFPKIIGDREKQENFKKNSDNSKKNPENFKKTPESFRKEENSWKTDKKIEKPGKFADKESDESDESPESPKKLRKIPENQEKPKKFNEQGKNVEKTKKFNEKQEKFQKFQENPENRRKLDANHEILKSFNGSGKREHKKQRRDGEWHEKMMNSREQARKGKNDNWFVERSRDRDIRRIQVSSNGPNGSNV